jgi:drug/metabolite transporter (DMT)-like permease
MKYLEYLTWIFGIFAGLVMLLGAIDFFFEVELVTVNHVINYFHVAMCFLLASICCTLYLIWNKKKQS